MSQVRHKIPDEEIYDGIVLWTGAIELLPQVQTLPSTPEDTFIGTYPRSGTTWISEILSMIEHNGDVDAMHSRNIWDRIPFLEFFYLIPNYGLYKGVELAKEREGTPRLLKTHLPYQLIQKQVEENGSKLVVVIRNVRDMLVSYYNFYKTIPQLGNFKGSWNEFFEMFKSKQLAWGDWLDHVRSYYAVRSRKNVHLIYYEDAVDDLQTTVQELLKFLGKSLPQETINKIVKNASFTSMRQNAEKTMGSTIASKVIRQGTYGGWREHFSPEQDEYIKLNYDKELEKMGLKLKF